MWVDLNNDYPRSHALLTDNDPPLYQNAWEWQRLLQLYTHCAPRRVLEIGTFHGGSLHAWLSNTAPGAVVVAIDDPAPGISPHTPQRWHEWAAEHGHTLHVGLGRSDHPANVALARAHARYDWIHLDADHSEAAIRHDVALALPLLAPGGMLVLHDINERPGYGVSVVWRELQRAGHLTQEFNAEMPACCGVGVVYG